VIVKFSRRSAAYTLRVLSSLVLFNLAPCTSRVTNPATDVEMPLPDTGFPVMEATLTFDVDTVDGAAELRRNARLHICRSPEARAVNVKCS